MGGQSGGSLWDFRHLEDSRALRSDPAPGEAAAQLLRGREGCKGVGAAWESHSGTLQVHNTFSRIEVVRCPTLNLCGGLVISHCSVMLVSVL